MAKGKYRKRNTAKNQEGGIGSGYDAERYVGE